MKENVQEKSREHQANERTFLAWIRTSIAIMAFGFVVVKFSLFLKQLSFLVGNQADVPTQGPSGIIGIILVAFGLVISLLAYLNYRRVKKQLDSSTFIPSGALPNVLIAVMGIIGIILMFYLIRNL